MAISLLTDSERKVFEEVCGGTTQTKIKKAIMDSGLPQVTAQIKAEIEALRREQAKRHKINGWQMVRNLAAKLVGDIDKYNS